MTPIAETDPNVAFQGIPPVAQAAAPTGPEAVEAAAQPADPLGPLAPWNGTWF